MPERKRREEEGLEDPLRSRFIQTNARDSVQIFLSTSLTPCSLSRTHLAPLLQTSNVVPESPGIRHQLVDEGNRVPLGLLVLDGSRRVHLFALSGFLGHTPRLQPTWAILAIVLKEGVWVWWWRGNSYGLGALPGRPRSTSGQDRRVYHGGTPNGLERNFAVTCGTSFEKDLVFRIRNRKRWSRT